VIYLYVRTLTNSEGMPARRALLLFAPAFVYYAYRFLVFLQPLSFKDWFDDAVHVPFVAAHRAARPIECYDRKVRYVRSAKVDGDLFRHLTFYDDGLKRGLQSGLPSSRFQPGGNLQGINGDGYALLSLPNSRFEIDIPLYFQSPPAPRPDAGVAPDWPVEPDIDDIAAGVDTELNYVLKRRRYRRDK
jgi:hypothetical protein